MISLSAEIYLSLYLNKFEKSAEEKIKRINFFSSHLYYSFVMVEETNMLSSANYCTVKYGLTDYSRGQAHCTIACNI
jgi:hypothetical protein